MRATVVEYNQKNNNYKRKVRNLGRTDASSK
jgi:hypothetical protein